MQLVASAIMLTIAGVTPAAAADAIRIAVAANFLEPAHAIVTGFEQASGHDVILSSGSTGQLFAQITQAAPFDVFLAADQVRAQKAVDQGFAEPGSRFTYAVGRLALFARDPSLITGPSILREGKFARLAIANPETAPYGVAALEVLDALDLEAGLTEKLVRANNITQTYQFVASGSIELGFVAFSQIAGGQSGSSWLVPDDLHAPIAQDAVLLASAGNNKAARAFLDYLKGDEARRVILEFGYDLPNG